MSTTPNEHPLGGATPVILNLAADKVEVDHSSDNNTQQDPAVQTNLLYALVSFFCMLVAFGGFVFGWDTGTISGFVNMPDFRNRFGEHTADGQGRFTNVRTGLIVGIFNIGCAIGGLTLGRLGDTVGRRNGLMCVMVVYIVGIVIQIASIDKWYQYFIGRIISGLAVGGVTVLLPSFIAETSPAAVRGTLVLCYQLMITLGIFLGYCTTYGTKRYDDLRCWRIPLGLCFAWAILMVVGMVSMPELPRYLLEKGRVEEAKVSLARVRRTTVDDPEVVKECELLQLGIEHERAVGKALWGELFTGKPRIFYRLFLGIMLQSLQQLTGDNYFFYYGTTIFKAVGMSDSFETSIVLGVINFAATFAGLYAVEKLGRRKTLLTGSIAMVICYVVYLSVGVTRLYPNGYDGATSTGAGNCMIVFTCFYIFFFAALWAPVVFVVVSETYPLRIRTKGMGMAAAANWIWGFLIAFFTPFITSAIHFAYGYVFMGCMVFSVFFVYFGVAETKGLSLEEVDELYASGVKPWQLAGWVPPSRYVTDMPANHKVTPEHLEDAV